MEPERTSGRILAARAIAVTADLVQLGLFPVFGEGALSPWNDGLDVVVAIVLTLLLGWHWVLLPSLVAELVPGLNLVPTWTAAVLYLTRGGPGPAAAGPPGAIDEGAPTAAGDARKR
jgi:hypothetical protein